MMENRSATDRPGRTARLVFGAWVIVCVAVALFPILVLLTVSVAPGAAIFGERPALIVTDPTFRFWRFAVAGGELWPPLVKSLAVAGLTTAGALAIAAPGAYAIARLPIRFRYGIVVGLLVTRMFPEFAIGVSVATRFAQLGLTDTYAGLTLAHLAGVLPFVAWLLVGAFEGVPRDVEAAAAIDGASRLATLGRVVLPMTAPALAVAALFAWLYSWNEFLYARLLTTSQNTLPLHVFQAIDRGTRQQMAAVAIVLVLPILGVVAVLQRHLRPGALAGAIRG
ncbi:MAG: carbohydrate ABC transporter permease, partial [Candidatus Rokuibacteriota bacterium]